MSTSERPRRKLSEHRLRQIGRQIVEARMLRSLDQWDLAHKLGVSEKTVGDWENGRGSPERRLKDLSEALGVEPEWLLTPATDVFEAKLSDLESEIETLRGRVELLERSAVPEILESYEFPEDRRKKTKYPYAEWLDGRIWRIDRGTDYQTTTQNLLVLLKSRAKEQRKQLVFDVHEDHLVFQAVSPEAASE